MGNTAAHAVVWTGTSAEDLGTLGGTNSYAYGINDSGQVTGEAYIAGDATYHAVLWTRRVAVDLGTLGGTTSEGFAVNASGQVTGRADVTGDTEYHAFRYSSGIMSDLGTLGGIYSYGWSINASGDIVGASHIQSGKSHAFLYTGGRMIDCNSFLPSGSGWLLEAALGINNNGWITGDGVINGATHTFLLKPNTAAVSGYLELEGVHSLSSVSPGAPLGTFHVSFRTPGTTTERFGADVSLTPTPGSATGTFMIPAVPNDTYDVTIQGGKNLRVFLRNQFISQIGYLPPVTLPAGDANGDNSVDSTNFGVLIGAFNSSASVPGSGYDATADFNFDGVVDSTDFGLLIGEFGSVGAP